MADPASRLDARFVGSRRKLLSWANSTFSLNLTKVEQCANGAFYCQAMDACHQGSIPMKKVNWSAKAPHEAVPNYKLLQQAFDRSDIKKRLEVDKLVRGKYQDNLEMLQWIKTYYDKNFPGGEYDAVGRRVVDADVDWAQGGRQVGSTARPMSPVDAPGKLQAPAPTTSQQLLNGPAVRGRGYPLIKPPNGVYAAEGEEERLREEVVDLKITVDGLETERDFYFQKLRDIEILCQALAARPDPGITVHKFAEEVQKILYAKDEDDGVCDGRLGTATANS